MIRRMLLLLCFLALVQITGCGGGGGGDDGAATGRLQVAITDAPAARTFTAVHITIEKVVAVPAGKEGLGDDDGALPVVATFPDGKEIDILNLHFVPQILGSAVLPAGGYSQIRLILAPNQPTLKNYFTLSGSAEKFPLTTPSAQQSGLKILGRFTVSAGTLSTVVVDFDPNAAIVFRGNSGQYNLKPTGIRITQVYNSLSNAGAITGQIRSPLFRPWSSATVTVRNSAGTPVSSGFVFSNYSSPGVWKAPFTAFLPPDSYKVFVRAYRDLGLHRPIFSLYSSPPVTVTTHVDTPVPPAGVVLLEP